MWFQNAVGSLDHYLLYCPFTDKIRGQFIPKFILADLKITSLIDNEAAVVISILDSESNLLPEDIRQSWQSSEVIYSLSRDYVFNMDNKCETLWETILNISTGWSFIYLCLSFDVIGRNVMSLLCLVAKINNNNQQAKYLDLGFSPAGCPDTV